MPSSSAHRADRHRCRQRGDEGGEAGGGQAPDLPDEPEPEPTAPSPSPAQQHRTRPVPRGPARAWAAPCRGRTAGSRTRCGPPGRTIRRTRPAGRSAAGRAGAPRRPAGRRSGRRTRRRAPRARRSVNAGPVSMTPNGSPSTKPAGTASEAMSSRFAKFVYRPIRLFAPIGSAATCGERRVPRRRRGEQRGRALERRRDPLPRGRRAAPGRRRAPTAVGRAPPSTIAATDGSRSAPTSVAVGLDVGADGRVPLGDERAVVEQRRGVEQRVRCRPRRPRARARGTGRRPRRTPRPSRVRAPRAATAAAPRCAGRRAASARARSAPRERVDAVRTGHQLGRRAGPASSDRANTVTQSCDRQAGTTPVFGTSPFVGLTPTRLPSAAGTRPEPAVSVPSAKSTMPERDRRGGPARRAAGDPRRVPGVPDRAEGRCGCRPGRWRTGRGSSCRRRPRRRRAAGRRRWRRRPGRTRRSGRRRSWAGRRRRCCPSRRTAARPGAGAGSTA